MRTQAQPPQAGPDAGAVTRRDALSTLVGAGVCACCALAGCQDEPAPADAVDGAPAPTARLEPPPVGEQVVTNFDALGLERPLRVTIGNVPVWVVRKQSSGASYVVAFDGRCPHARCKIEYMESGYHCPCHGSHFDQEGRRLSGPARRGLRSLYCVVRDGAVYVDLGREAAAASQPAGAAPR